jgi:putative ABC transport system permease protein
MLKNILTVAIRNLLKQRFYSILNVFGLGVGLAVFMVISLYIDYQFSYDGFHEKGDRLYRIDQTFIWGDAYPTFGSTGPGVSDAIRTDIPGVEQTSRVYTVGDRVISVPSQQNVVAYEDNGVGAVDSTFLQLFTFQMIAGDASTALDEPFSVVITRSSALKYFGKVDALGQTLKMTDGRTEGLYKVTGVMEDVPPNSHFSFNILASMSSFPEVAARKATWFWSGFVTYALLKKGANPELVREAIFDLPSKRAGQAYETITSGGKPWHLYLVPLSDIWLHSVSSPNRLGPTSNILYVYVLSAIAIMVLVLASVNYMNMATARSVSRSKEVGVRKMMGALKEHLLFQFLAESFILVILSSALAVGLVELCLPYFNSLAGIQLSTLSLFNSGVKVAFLLAIVFGTALLAGAYPAFYMARFSPIQALRKQNKVGRGGQLLRGGLVVFQFAISITLVVLSFIVYDQISYLQNRDLGFDKDNLIIVPQVQRMDSVKRVSFREVLSNNPSVASVGMSTSVPPNIWDGDSFTTEEDPENEQPINYMNVSNNYLQTLGVDVLYGRIFEEGFQADRTSVVLNENAVKALGWNNDETVIGKKLVYWGTRFNVIGVIKDFNYWTLDSPIQPLAVFPYGAPITHQETHFLSVRLKPENNQAADVKDFLSFLTVQWDEFAPGLPFSYQFTDAMFFSAFEFEQRLGQLFSVFTGLAILIACMGLLGLASYMAEVRNKEIGIRKVLGASVSQLVVLMGKDFARLVIIAFAISVPLGWWAANMWLQNYQYRTNINWQVFIYAGLSALVLAVLTVSYQSVKTAFSNPVDVLHEE